MSGLSTHVLDTALGRPAAGIAGEAARRLPDGSWRELARAATDPDGRARDLLPPGTPLAAGTYRLRFDLAGYFRRRGVAAFYPEASVVFTVSDPASHHHVPLLLSPFGYTTYRGS
jgi:5-hydroxyisourate hydrolase